MRILREHLLLALITLLSGNVADKSPFHDGTQNENVLQNDDTIDYRLPPNVKPLLYEINLIPNLDSYTFDGTAKINAEVVHATNNITLHVGNIQIISVSVLIFENPENLSTSYDKITEKYTITLTETFEKGRKFIISFTYNGTLSDNMIGFYRSSYLDKNKQIKRLAATQFQTTHARHAFPCFDEPSFKAQFIIHITRDDNYNTLSNMPLTNSTRLKPGGKIWDVYGPSIPMSTYLVAFVIADFDSLPKISPFLPTKEIAFKVWSKPSTIDQATYALDVGRAALELLENKFGQTYALPKMDMVAVPDFAAGAMENWGLVTYRESRMLYDKKESSVVAQQDVASVIAHELTHMWFGNLVTPEWWNCLWLSEAFATYFQYFATAELEPTWRMEQQFVVQQHQSALIADSVESSLPMTRVVSNKSQIAGVADTITYNKGGSIIRMMSLIFGTEIFDNALRSYIQDNMEQGLGQPDALWEAVKAQVNNTGVHPSLNIDVKTVMDSWTTQAGYPVLTVDVNDNGILKITQKRFLLRNIDNIATDTVWYVPLTFTTKSKPDFTNLIPKYWMSTEQSTAFYKIDPNEWIIFNLQSSGFYRVNYNNRGWENILYALKNDDLNNIHVLNRAAIVDDLLNLGRAGYISYDTVLDGLYYLPRETDYLPYKAAFNGLEFLNKRFTGSMEHTLFKVYVESLIENVNVRLEYDDNKNDDRLTILLRRDVNNWLCKLDNKECVTIYTEKFKAWRTNSAARIEPNARPTAYCTAIKHGTSDDWEYLWQEYFNSNYPTDQMVILNALGCSQNTTILEKYLKYAIAGYETSRIRKQDSKTVFAAVYNSGLLGAEYILDFVDKYHKEMEEYYGEQSTIATILDGTSQCLTTAESINKFDRLINNHREDFTSIQQSLERSLKIAQHELELFNSYSASIIQRLRKYDEATFPLPENIIPKSYIVSVTPYFEDEDATVDGKVTIKADVKYPTSQIVLHWSGIEIKRHNVTVTFIVKTENIVNKVLKTKIKERYDFLVIYLEKELPKDAEVTIEITYTSSLNPAELRGFYKSSYVNENNETRWLVASHLEPVGARKMFPCFDEPAMKATFTVEVSVPPNYEPISNMVYQALLIGDNRTTYTFYETPKMSTYLVALIVSDFKSNSTRMQDGTTLSVHARTNAIDQTDYALSIISPLMSFFEKRYNQKYPLSKLSMAALPDFGSGAMENWGLLTYRESSMLYDENHSPITNRQDIRNVIAHEISHQWFGNLVSPRLWKYLWLNEGFARYFEYHAPARVFNDTTSESQFVVDQVHSAFKADSSKSAHALSHDVASPEQIRSIFDTITYAKGGSILRMVEKTFGTDVLDKALTDYLSKRQYNSTEPDHLYDSLQQQINEKGLKEDIKVILDTWTIHPGYPIVNVHVSNTFIVMNQTRFFLKKEEDNSNTTRWHIPITWTSVQNSSKDSDTTPKLWIKDRIKRVLNPSPNSLLIFNKQQSGFYRVNYKKEHWMELIDYLKNENFETIDEINRAALIDDLMNLARAGYIDYKIAISATMYLKQETSYYPWIAFFNNLPYLNNRFTGRDIEGLYKNWLTSLVDNILGNLGGFEDDKEIDDDLTMMLRKHTRNWACKLGIDRCIFTALKYFQEKQHSKTIPPNYRDVVYCTAMRKDKTDYSYKFLWKEYLSSNVNTDKLVILNSLACSENKVVLETLLREAITPNSNIRYQDSAKVFSSVYDASLIGVEVVMEVIQNYYDNLLQRHYNDYTKIANIVSALASRLSTNDLFEKYQGLLEWLVDKEPEFKRYVDSYLATAKYEFDWYDTKAPVVFETLDNLFSSNTHRLPKALEPRLYDIHLTPHMEEGTFEGKVKIHMDVRENTPLIALNSHKLDILNIKVFRNGAEIQLVNYTTHIPQQLRIYLSNYVHANEEIIAEIDFNGTLNDDMNGFYRSSYLDNGVQHWLATTQFEPTYARQAFPCFDEPAFKSKFTINIQRPKNYYKSLSNMPLEKETPVNDEYVLDTFYTSNVNMSTYLVAFVVSKFKPTSKPDNVHLNVWGRPEVASHGERARIIGMQVIRKLENITDIDFPLPKLDLIGIPDFSNGAMENWGLATFREYGLFFDKKETTSTYEKYISNVIAHELTHMWFGNLVTCEWWDYIWLNEGFAEYFEWFISEQIHPEDKFMDQFVVYELHPALAKDASTSTHSMTNRVRTPEEIADIFDYVTYGKSASVLRMMFNAFGQNATISALRDYLTKRMYSTARPADLWESFESFVKIPILNRDASVEEVMSTWTDQPGYPVVNATYISSILTLSQERFLINKNKPDDEPKFSEFYWIPITIFVQSNMLDDNITSEVTWLGSTPQTKIINSNNDWFIVNYKQTGFYRVNYDPFSWKKIINQLNNKEFEKIDVLNRAQIIDDLFNLARANYVDYELLMSASTYLKQEKNHLPWKAFFNGLSYVHERFEQHSTGNNSQFLKDLNGYLLDLVSDMYDKVGFEDCAFEELIDKLNREIILQWTCKLNKTECIKKSVDLFAAWRNDSTKQIPRNARPAVYCTAIKEGSSSDWDFLWNHYRHTNFASEKKIIIDALGCSNNKTVLQNYLKEAIKKYNPANADIRRQDVSAVFTSVYSAGSVGVNVTLNFLTENIDTLYDYFQKWDDIANLFVNTAAHVSTEVEYGQAKYFVERHERRFPENLQVRLRSAVTTAESNLLWFKNNGYKIRQWIMNLNPEKLKPDSSTRIESFNIVLTTLIALVSYLLSRF